MSDPRWQGCTVPPKGWWCSRKEGHDGPCAARAERAPHDEPLSPQGLEPTAFDPSREWHFAFESPIGARHLRSGFWCIEAGFGDPSDANPLWWDHDNRRWLAHDEVPWGKNNPARTFTLGSSAPCRSFAAFRRHVRRHADKLAGHRVRLVSRWVGCDVVASGMSAGTAETRSGSGLQPASPVGESRDAQTSAKVVNND